MRALAFFLLCPLGLIGVEPESISLVKHLRGQIKEKSEGLEIGFQFRGQQLADADFARISKIPNIISLNLRDTQITNAGLKHLENCRELKRLHLERTGIGDAGLAHLANLNHLEYLNLYGTNVTDKGLEALQSLSNLSQLFVWDTQVTEKGAEALKETLPQLKIFLGVELNSIVVEEEKEEPEVLAELEWLPEGENAKPPKKSIAGIGIKMVFVNKRKLPVKLYWVDYGGGLKQYGVIDPDGKREQNTFSKAVWLIMDMEENRLGYFVTTEKNAMATIPAE